MSVSKTGKLKGNTKYFAIKPRRTQYNTSSFSWSRVSNFSPFHVTINMALDWTLFLEEGAKLALLFTALSVSTEECNSGIYHIYIMKEQFHNNVTTTI